MFDIGFSEIVVCAIVALLVIGPERMPEAVRTVGLWIGRLKRGLRETRSEIERQIGVDDIRRQLHNEDIMRSLEDARRDMDNVVAQTQASLSLENDVVEREYQSEPDLPYHAHHEETAALEAITNQAEENTTPLPDLLASQIESLDSQAESKIQLDKKTKPTTLAAGNHLSTLESKTTTDNKATLDSKATL